MSWNLFSSHSRRPQETKLANIDQYCAAYLGGYRLRGFAQRLAVGSRGGILLLWDESTIEVKGISTPVYYLSAMFLTRDTDMCYKLTNVYGPTSSSLKDAFFAKLLGQKPIVGVM